MTERRENKILQKIIYIYIKTQYKINIKRIQSDLTHTHRFIFKKIKKKDILMSIIQKYVLKKRKKKKTNVNCSN